MRRSSIHFNNNIAILCAGDRSPDLHRACARRPNRAWAAPASAGCAASCARLSKRQARPSACRPVAVRANEIREPTPKGQEGDRQDPARAVKSKRQSADSTDWVASSLSRRFGLAGGLAWVAFLAIGTLGEQVKTRLEVANEEKGVRDVSNQPVVELASGVTYQDLRIGAGAQPRKGDLVVLDYKASADGVVFEDTTIRKKPIVFPFRSRPFTGGVNAGVEEVLAGMNAGGKRRCTVPPSMGFGDKAYALKGTLHAGDKEGVVPPNSTLEYELTLVRVSIAPS